MRIFILLIILAIGMLSFLPIPNIYGDDLNVSLAIHQHGFFGAWLHWLDNYGSLYRPIGYLWFLIVSVFGQIDHNFAFFIHFLLIVLTVAQLCRVLSFYCPLFFIPCAIVPLFFIVNSTVLFQLSTMPMVLSSFLFLTGIALFLKGRKINLLLLFWMVSILCYELIIPAIIFMSSIFFIGVVRVERGKGEYSALELSLKHIFCIISFLIVYLGFYFFDGENPKISVYFLEIQDESQEVNSFGAADTLLQSDPKPSFGVSSQLLHRLIFEVTRVLEAQQLDGSFLSLGSLHLFGLLGCFLLALFMGRYVLAGVNPMLETSRLIGFFGLLGWAVVALTMIAPFIKGTDILLPAHVFWLPAICGAFWIGSLPLVCTGLLRRSVVFGFGVCALLVLSLGIIEFGLFLRSVTELAVESGVSCSKEIQVLKGGFDRFFWVFKEVVPRLNPECSLSF